MGRKRRIIFILLLVFWLIVSTTLGIPHILIGLFFWPGSYLVLEGLIKGVS